MVRSAAAAGADAVGLRPWYDERLDGVVGAAAEADIGVAAVTGRHEPGTGEIRYPFILSALAEAGYEGYVGCEFEPTGVRDRRSGTSGR